MFFEFWVGKIRYVSNIMNIKSVYIVLGILFLEIYYKNNWMEGKDL